MIWIGLIIISFTVGYSINGQIFAQVGDDSSSVDLETNVGLIVTMTGLIAGIITTVAGIIPVFVVLKQRITGVKSKTDDIIIEASKSISESDWWSLETQTRLRKGLTAGLTIFDDFNEIITHNRDKLTISEQTLRKINDNLKVFKEIIPTEAEEQQIKEELVSISNDPKRIG